DRRGADAAAGAGTNVLATVGLTLGKVALLVAAMLFVGVRAVPWLLAQVARTGSRELFILAVLAVALGVAFGSAVLFGVSLALGAFLAGLVVGESDLSHQAAEDALPLRDAFAVLFFVSVGMLFDPAILLTSPGRVLAVVLMIVVGKSLAAFLLVVALGRPARTGLIVAAGLAQIGEFSFILAELGRTLGLLPDEGHSLILAGALLSITLNPLLFRAIDPLEARLRRLPRAAAILSRGTAGAEPAELPHGAGHHAPRDHAVLCGYGRVGRLIGEALKRHGVPCLVVEEDRTRVQEARSRGIAVLHGDAADGTLLAHMGLAEARLLVVAIPDPLATRHIVEEARRQNPGLAVVARTHSEEEWAYLSDGRVSEAVLGERELALAMARLSLHYVGADGADGQVVPQAVHGPR
nr:cation:proton antiporter [Chloroflexota bacterium]